MMPVRRIIAILRAADRAEPLRTLLTARGYETVVHPVTRIEPLKHPRIQEWTSALSDADWIAFTSPAGVENLARGFGSMAHLSTLLKDRPVAALGQRASDRLRSVGIIPRIIEPEGGAYDLGKTLSATLQGSMTVLHACGAEARPELGEVLIRAGHRYQRLVCYRTRPIPLAERGQWRWQDWSTAVVAAPSTVATLSDDPMRPAGFSFIAIGPTTAAALRRRGMALLGVAPAPDAESVAGFIAAVCPRVNPMLPAIQGDAP